MNKETVEQTLIQAITELAAYRSDLSERGKANKSQDIKELCDKLQRARQVSKDLEDALETALKILPIGFASTGRSGGSDFRNEELRRARERGVDALAKARGEQS